jgi:hypothetical protein
MASTTSAFSEAELDYLRGERRLARIAPSAATVHLIAVVRVAAG